MILKNVAGQGVYLFAYNSSGAKTGDAANITGYSSIDGATPGTVFGTAHPTEVDATHMPGVYWQPLAQGEVNGNALSLCWTSSTSGVMIDPVLVLTTGVNLPVAAPAASGGLPTVGTGSGQVNPASGKMPATLASTDVTGNVAADIQTVKTQAVTCSASVTVGAYLGNATAALAADASGRVLLQPTQTGVTIPTVTTVTNAVTLPTGTGAGQISLSSGAVLLQASQPGVTIPTVTTVTNAVGVTGDLSATMKTSVTTACTAATPNVGGYQSGQDPATLVLDCLASSHNTSLTIGAKINSAASAGDPLATSVPGSYPAGTAGYILGHKIAATLASTDVTGNVACDVQTIKTQAVTCAAGVTVGAYLGNATAVLAVDASGNVSLGAIRGSPIYSYDGTIQSATSTTVTLPTTDAYGISIPDNTAHEWAVLQIVGGTGAGQMVKLTMRVGAWTFGVLSGSMPVQLDGTSQYLVAGTWRSQALLNATDVTGNVAANVQATASALTFNLTGNVSGSVGSVTGSVGSVTGLTTRTIATAILATPANVLATDSSGRVILQPTQAGVTIPTITTVTNPVTAGTVNDKTGYALSASGLNAIPVTDPGTVASTWPQMVVQTWRRWFKPARKDALSGNLYTYADNGTTVDTTQAWTDDGAGTETITGAQ